MAEQTFVDEGVVFYVTDEADGKFVADVSFYDKENEQTDTARVVGRFNSLGEAITAAKHEIEEMRKVRG